MTETEPVWQSVAGQIGERVGRSFRVEAAHPVAGGDINRSYVLQGDGERFFVKLNEAGARDMFEAEADALAELAAADAVRVPAVVTAGNAGGRAFLVLEYIPMRPLAGAARESLGEALAGLHACRQQRFGWHRDNFIGTTPQPNGRSRSWVSFFREQRLAHQLALASSAGHDGMLLRLGESLCERLGDFFSDYTPEPSLLHGDLWGGNAAQDDDGRPVIYDPATYYGDRETDLAMTELFGGFGGGFRAAYDALWPVDPGYRVRRELYQLYHILNHLNLFGGGFAGRAREMMESLLSQVRG